VGTTAGFVGFIALLGGVRSAAHANVSVAATLLAREARWHERLSAQKLACTGTFRAG